MSRQTTSDTRKDLAFSITTGLHQKKILELLRNNLHGFTREFLQYATPDSLQESFENYISGELSNFLNNKLFESNYIFGFHADGPDILVHQFPYRVHASELFIVEAKRLPPTSNQDYVKSGIGRFKKEKHGKRHGIAAMLGYVQDKNFDHWYKEINSWIEELIATPDENPRWVKRDKLRLIRRADVGEYRSMHSRINENPITLYHFWVPLFNVSEVTSTN